MKRIFFLFVCFFLAAGSAFSQEGELKTIFVADSTVQIDVPISFSGPKKIQNVPGQPNPGTENWILLGKNNLISLRYQFTFDTSTINITDNDIPEWADKQMNLLKQDERYTYLDDGIFLQEGKNIGYIKYSLKQEEAPDSFEMLFFANVNNRLIQFLFTCPLKLRKKWELVADKIANSIRIEEKN